MKKEMLEHLESLWSDWSKLSQCTPIAPVGLPEASNDIIKEPLPEFGKEIDELFDELRERIVPQFVKNSNPKFLAYVTPPTLEISIISSALIALFNQNVSFNSLSPGGTAIEKAVIRWFAKFVGYNQEVAGGIMTSGGSVANLQALAIGRNRLIQNISKKNVKSQRIYCSEKVHRSVHKAAIILGIGTNNVVGIPTNEFHQIDLKKLEHQIEKDFQRNGYNPATIVGVAGSRACGSFDDIKSLRTIADRYNLWLHVDAAYSAFLKLASGSLVPKQLDFLHLADSITMDPHKLLFMPFDCGCLLVKDENSLLETFGVEGEYLEQYHSPKDDFRNYGIQLGRSMKSFNIWMAFKYLGVSYYKKELTRILELAEMFKVAIQNDQEFELAIQSSGIIICFRWIGFKTNNEELNLINSNIKKELVYQGTAFINGVKISNMSFMRVCICNFNTGIADLENLLQTVKSLGQTLSEI